MSTYGVSILGADLTALVQTAEAADPVSAVQRPTPSMFGLTASERRVGDDGITHRDGLKNSGLHVENLRVYA
jgi:hypothetical protein